MLSNPNHFGVLPMTQAINELKTIPAVSEALGIFTQKMLTTTYVSVERRNNHLSLVSNVTRGTVGEPIKADRHPPQVFATLHLPKSEAVLADDVQNVRAFGTANSVQTLASLVNDKLLAMKADIDYTREYHKMNALLGLIKNPDGTTLVDIYQRFNLTRTVTTIKASDKDEIGVQIDNLLAQLTQKIGGTLSKGFVVLAGSEFINAIIYHKTVKEAYLRYSEAATYRTENLHIGFEYKGIKFVRYDHLFDDKPLIKPNEGIILPLVNNAFVEFFAPANYTETVNTLALPYYAKREKMTFDKGFILEAQSNPLPLLLRPELVQTVRLG